MSAKDTIPAVQQILSVETLPLTADLAAELGQGETLQSATVELIQVDNCVN